MNSRTSNTTSITLENSKSIDLNQLKTPTISLFKRKSRVHEEQKDSQQHERCGEILPTLSETEEVIMLGGKGDEGGRKNINHKSSTTICAFGDALKPTCANNTEKILANIDDVIEFVVNDISGTKTGLDVQNRLNKVTASQSSNASDEQYKVIKNLLSSHIAFSKPAPASKKMLSRLNLSKEYLNSNPKANQLEIVQPDVHHDSIHETISRTTECSVPTLDLFQSTPLSRLICSGCFRKYNDKNAHPVNGESQDDLSDDISVNLVQGTITTVCANCSWWTKRSVKGKWMKFKS